MKHRGFSVVVALVLVAIGCVVLPAPRAFAAGITSISIDYFPANIPTDAASSCSGGGGTPFAMLVTVNGTANQNFAIKTRLGTGACTWRPDNGTWTSDSTTFTGLTRGTIEPDGNVSLWLFGRANSNATTSLTVRARGCDAVWSVCADTIDSSAQTVALMNMTSSGGWLEETNGAARAGRAFVVKNSTGIVGMYVSEDNGVNEGYPATLMPAAAPAVAGYSRVAVPACTECNYTVESWDLAAPGTAGGQIHTMGSGGCPNSVTAAGTTSLDACISPTVISLRALNVDGGISPQIALPFVGLALLSGLAALVRRCKV
jgi:hypothetical protein